MNCNCINHDELLEEEEEAVDADDLEIVDGYIIILASLSQEITSLSTRLVNKHNIATKLKLATIAFEQLKQQPCMMNDGGG